MAEEFARQGNTPEWKSYYLAIGMTSRYVEHTIQHFMDAGCIRSRDFFQMLEEKKKDDTILFRQLVPAHLASNRFQVGLVDFPFLLQLEIWGYYARKYLFIYQAILRYGRDEASLQFIYENLIMDLKENVEEEIILLKRYTKNIFK